MTGPFPASHQHTVTALFGPTAILAGSLGTPTMPGTLTISTGGRVLGTGTTFAQAVEAATAKAASLVVNREKPFATIDAGERGEPVEYQQSRDRPSRENQP